MNSEPSTDDAKFRYGAALAEQIELKWQQIWSDQGTHQTPNPTGKLAADDTLDPARKLFVMDMFPYPSGSGLHVGHPLGYIASDVYSRYMRMKGKVVLHPFGFDAFGLPAEQYAIETGQHPAITTEQNIANMRRQLGRLGLNHDPRRAISTADPKFYRWTQWIFLQLFNSWCDPATGQARPVSDLIAEFEQGSREPKSETNPENRPWSELDDVTKRRVIDSYRLAFQSEAPVNWCPGLGTVLANEEVTTDGRSQVGNYPVYRRRMKQWMLRITAFADRLLSDLDSLDWTESLKTMQRNWIGRSVGADIRFQADAGSGIQVFTTRPDTLFGATFLVLAPEHPLVKELTADEWPQETPDEWKGTAQFGAETAASPRSAVTAYVEQTARVSDRQRQAETSKTAVFLGSYAVNPVSGEKMPILISDYVLVGYGTGAIMAVPAHDQRDYELATEINLPLVPVVRPDEQWLSEHEGAVADRPATWGEAFHADGTLVNSHGTGISLDGLGTDEAKDRVASWLEESGLGARRITYKLRDWLFSRQRYWGEPFPIVYDETGLPIALPESQLPVELPPMTDFRPQAVGEDEDPKAPLSRAPGFEHVELDLGDGLREYRRETNTMPQWAGSCWYYLRYLDPDNDQCFVDPDVEKFWMAGTGEDGRIGGVDLYIGGVEHAVLHLLYSRFWHKVLFDLGHVSTPEPFQRLYNQGYILADAFTNSNGRYVPALEVEETPDGPTYQGEPVKRHYGKMGKSLKNSISPDEIYQSYGADTLRMYEMVMGPLDVDRPWQPDDIVGVYRFLQRLWRNVVNEDTGALRAEAPTLAADDALYKLTHRTISEVTGYFDDMRFNVAIARMIELNNALTQFVQRENAFPREAVEALVLMTFPLASHVSSELWERLGHQDRIDDVAFPAADPDALQEDSITIPVTLNNKPRGTITIAKDADQEGAMAAAQQLENVAGLMEGQDVVRVVFVPGKILNIVTKPQK
ncbi:MAG: leucine--tRNA ligase [Streptosporangiales bacterium]|nr:leucine--tRNA ligase [Streptosporangiales bacterium]